MEQTNLVVTPDGKTWDEVTRDTSYLGSTNLLVRKDGGNGYADTVYIADEFRGKIEGADRVQKDFAIAYDRFICLKDGNYAISFITITWSGGNSSGHCVIYVNGVASVKGYWTDADNYNSAVRSEMYLKRGDYVQIKSASYEAPFNEFTIHRL